MSRPITGAFTDNGQAWVARLDDGQVIAIGDNPLHNNETPTRRLHNTIADSRPHRFWSSGKTDIVIHADGQMSYYVDGMLRYSGPPELLASVLVAPIHDPLPHPMPGNPSLVWRITNDGSITLQPAPSPAVARMRGYGPQGGIHGR